MSSRTLYWLFLPALTTGARIEELGQALLTDVKVDGDVIYIDVDDYAIDDEAEDVAKSVKNANSRRVIPVHDNLTALGLQRYASLLRKAGEIQLFPDLIPGRFGKRTKEASRATNRLIDKFLHQIDESFVDLSAIRQARSAAAWNADVQAPGDNWGEYYKSKAVIVNCSPWPQSSAAAELETEERRSREVKAAQGEHRREGIYADVATAADRLHAVYGANYNH